jgi:threonine aldolase
MQASAVEQKILEKLDFLSKEVEDIREHMVDVDVILSMEEKKLLIESLKHEKEGKLISLEDLENVRRKVR